MDAELKKTASSRIDGRAFLNITVSENVADAGKEN